MRQCGDRSTRSGPEPRPIPQITVRRPVIYGPKQALPLRWDAPGTGAEISTKFVRGVRTTNAL